jgi:hypothetical protein
MDIMLLSQVLDTPVLTLDVAVLINSRLHYLLQVEMPDLRRFALSCTIQVPVNHR